MDCIQNHEPEGDRQGHECRHKRSLGLRPGVSTVRSGTADKQSELHREDII